MAPQKRKAPGTPETPETSGRRRSGRISSSGTKSRYFEGDSSEESDATPAPALNGAKKRGRGRPPKNAAPARTSIAKKTKKAKKANIEDDEDDEDDGDDYAEETSEDHNGGGGEDDDDFDEDQEMRVTVTPLIKLRETGGVPYEDERLHKNTMLFLKDLKANNKRSWLKCL